MKKLGTHKKKAELFVQNLLEWNHLANSRQMPWKGEKDPYKIWLSEIILQQTRVDQGWKYYENFINAFPDVHALASAPEEKVFKLWEGLGYYSRCRNLIATARYISKELRGKFPSSYSDILQLKGIGPYTAAAIASFAFRLPYAVLDGNVFRVLSRIFDIDTPIDSTIGKKQFSNLAQEVLPPQQAAEYNQAIMDFGAVICKPVPECNNCFFNRNCSAYLSGTQDLLPVKAKKTTIKERWMNYLVLTYKDQIAVHQRTGKDIWQQLFEFFLIESEGPVTDKKVLEQLKKQYGITGFDVQDTIQTSQRLSHRLVHFRFIRVKLNRKEQLPGFHWVKADELDQYAFPKTLHRYIGDYL
jgi:A/G-specific adenine glycosylase